MGSLLRTPHSEVTATLERLEHFGATADDLREIRSNDEAARATVEAIQTITGNLYISEEVESNFTYPPEYTGPKPIRAQVEALLAIPAFKDLDTTWALEEGQKWYDGLSLPEWIEGPLVYVWHEALGGYHTALNLALEAIGSSRKLHNYRKGQMMTSDHLRQHEKTVLAERALKEQQPGGFIIVPSQAGLRWRGKSIRRTLVRFEEGEFGLGALTECCRAITHPERFVRWEQLHVDCPGDEFAPDAGGAFSRAFYLSFLDGRVEFVTVLVDKPHAYFGSASGFLSQ
jgi:hypothetical protein